DDHLLPLKLQESCPQALEGLAVETSPPTDTSVVSLSSDGRRLTLSVAHVPRSADRLRLKLLSGPDRNVVGSLSIRISDAYLTPRSLPSDPQRGELDSIPPNRPAQVQVVSDDPRLAAALVPQPLPGYYRVLPAPGRNGHVILEGLTPSLGTVPVFL